MFSSKIFFKPYVILMNLKEMCRLKKNFSAAVFFGAAFLASASAQAQVVVNEQDPLTFGEAVVLNNNGVYTVSVDSNGNYSSDPEFLFVTPPQEGVYIASGFVAFEPITDVTIMVDQQMIGPGVDFTISNFDIDFPSNADGSGNAIIRVGAEMSTTGTVSSYQPSSNFEAEFTLTIDH
jgi:hypothetical protein